MTDTIFTPEFISSELAKATKATKKTYCFGTDSFTKFGEGMANADFIDTAANHYEAALKEIEQQQARAEKAERKVMVLRNALDIAMKYVRIGSAIRMVQEALEEGGEE